MKQTSLTRRLLAGGVGLMVGVAGAVALATPAAAEDHEEAATTYAPFKSVKVEGAVECDEESGDSTVTWTVTNDSITTIGAVITDVVADGEIDGDIEVGTPLGKGESASGTQTFPEGTGSASLEVELTWTWTQWKRVWVPGKKFWQRGHYEWQEVEKSKSKSASATVDLEDCKAPPPPDPDPVPPNIIVVVTCDLLAFIVDNSEGDAEVAVSFVPNETVTHGHASGFSYTIDENDEVVVTIDDDASVETVGEADSENPVNLAFSAGDAAHTHAFEAFAGLEVTVELSLDGESFEFEDGENVVSWDEEVADLDCDEGQGGELPVTGASTGLIALSAVVLLALGGGLFLVARRRRVTFTA